MKYRVKVIHQNTLAPSWLLASPLLRCLPKGNPFKVFNTQKAYFSNGSCSRNYPKRSLINDWCLMYSWQLCEPEVRNFQEYLFKFIITLFREIFKHYMKWCIMKYKPTFIICCWVACYELYSHTKSIVHWVEVNGETEREHFYSERKQPPGPHFQFSQLNTLLFH